VSEFALVSGGYDGKLNLFDVRQHLAPVASIKHEGSIVNDIVFSPMGSPIFPNHQSIFILRDLIIAILGLTLAASCYNAGVMLYDMRKFSDDKVHFRSCTSASPFA